jgi:2-iminobutanoate/2-iminopropanoate deaminase
MGNRRVIQTAEAPAAIGPYSQAIRHGDLLFVSGQTPMNPEGELVAGGLGEQTKQCLRNIEAIARAAGTGLEAAVKVTIYTTRMEGFAEINEAYAGFFGDEPPARATIGVAALPLGAEVEIEAVIALG